MNIDISSGNLVINERRSYYSCLIFGVSSNLYLTDADIIQYSILITNLEMFGADYWKMFKAKMSHHIHQLDPSVVDIPIQIQGFQYRNFLHSQNNLICHWWHNPKISLGYAIRSYHL